MTISSNKFIACTYNLYVGGEERELMEQATAERPLEYLHGMGMMLPAFEKELTGLKVGDKFSFDIPNEEAYGDREEEAVIELPKNIFQNEAGEFDSTIVYEGNIIPMRDNEGNTLQGAVLAINEDTVTIDFNHPLAGEDLHFEGEVLTVRDANEADTARFFNSEGGCGCGCDDESESGCGGCSGGCN